MSKQHGIDPFQQETAEQAGAPAVLEPPPLRILVGGSLCEVMGETMKVTAELILPYSLQEFAAAPRLCLGHSPGFTYGPAV